MFIYREAYTCLSSSIFILVVWLFCLSHSLSASPLPGFMVSEKLYVRYFFIVCPLLFLFHFRGIWTRNGFSWMWSYVPSQIRSCCRIFTTLNSKTDVWNNLIALLMQQLKCNYTTKGTMWLRNMFPYVGHTIHKLGPNHICRNNCLWTH